MAGEKKSQEITDEKLIPGRIVEIELTRQDGLILKDGYESRIKYIVIVGIDSDRFIFANLLINSKSYDFTEELANQQYPIRKADYLNFLKYDSFVDCSVIRVIDRNRLKKYGKDKGLILQKDLDDIFKVIQESDTISPKEKRFFNLK